MYCSALILCNILTRILFREISFVLPISSRSLTFFCEILALSHAKPKGNVSKQGYTLCFLDKLQDSLKRRDVYVENSDRWGDTRTKLLQGADWHNNRIQICRLLGHPLAPHDAIAAMTNRLDATYKKVAANFDNNRGVTIIGTKSYSKPY